MENNQATTLEEYLLTHQQSWSTIVHDLNSKMKNFADLPDLQNIVYAKRQDVLDYYFNILSIQKELFYKIQLLQNTSTD